jgi:hypothetical protein
MGDKQKRHDEENDDADVKDGNCESPMTHRKRRIERL